MAHKIYENLSIEPIIQDGSLQISPDGKYICVASSEYITIIQTNTDMLKLPIPNFFCTTTNLDLNKTHGTQLVNKFMPVRQIIKGLNMKDQNVTVCDAKVGCKELFMNNVDIKKLRWSPRSFQTEHSLLGSLNTLGFLEIIYSHGSQNTKIFQINNLWFQHCMKNYFKKYKYPTFPSELKPPLMNCCSLLWIESFVWIPMTDKECGLLLVCYHKRGIITIWKIKQEIQNQLDTIVNKSSINLTNEKPCSSQSTPTMSKKKKVKKEEPTEVVDTFNHKCNLLKVVTDYCEDPFSEKNLIYNEFKLKPGDKVLDIDYIKLNETQHTIIINRGNGTLQLWELDLTDISNNDTDEETSMDEKNKTDNAEATEIKLEQTSMNEKNKTDNAETTGIKLEQMDVDIEEELFIESVKIETKQSETDTTETNHREAFIPTYHNVFDKKDNMVISNLLITYANEKIIIVFNKLSVLFCIQLTKDGKLLDRFHHRIKTRAIISIVKHSRENYLVGTHENRLLLVHISESNNLEFDDKLNLCYLSNTDNRIFVRQSIAMPNETHLLNGIVNSHNSYLTLLSFKIKVRTETNFLSRRPCFLSLTTLYSEPNLLTGQPPDCAPHQQVDFIKCAALNGLNIAKLGSMSAGIRDARLKYFLLKLFKPKSNLPSAESQLGVMLDQLEKTIYLKYVKRCVEQSIFSSDRKVLVLFREWVSNNFPGDCYTKLKASFPNDPYEESCFLCAEQVQVNSMRYALCSAGHRVIRCSLSLVQCMESCVRCCYCYAYVCTSCTENPTISCVFCDAKIPQVR